MTASTRVPATEITGARGALMKFAARRMLGEVPESLGVMWHNPTVLMGLMGVNRKAEKWNELDKDLVVLADMAAAAAVGCSFCLDLNYFLAHSRGLDEAKAREAPRWRESSSFAPLERRVMEYADAMSRTPVAVTDELSAALLEELGAPALLELTARIAIMNTSARANIALGIRSQGLADSCGLVPLASATVHVGSTA
ncbi:carboxymuconolactone decarboxylase family protein [Microbacterium deminutum]|uniref:Carboxymuconolactone decarboxylase-like domain-containing protein n=1 Tax=Microbacterium deminutum TaxID=344164 RepID=A0ABN2Q525_9MICO